MAQQATSTDELQQRCCAVVALHPDVLDVADLPPGWDASRASKDAPWVRFNDTSDA